MRAMRTLLALCALLTGCNRPPADGAKSAPGAPNDLRLLALGDSYTIGERVEPADRWPVRLAALLRDEGLAVAEPTLVARTGWTTDELASAMDSTPLESRYDLVTLLIGVNNQYRGRDAEEYRRQFVQLLQRSIALAGGDAKHVVVLSIPDWGVMPFAASYDRNKVGREIDQFNAIGRAEAERLGAAFVDITPLSRHAAMQPALIADDGLHPSAAMYRQWAESALPAARLALQPPASQPSR